MPSTYSPNLNLELQATGENDGTWGVKVNADLSQIDLSMGGRLSLSVAGSTDVMLTDAQAQNVRHTYTGALTGNISVIVPNTGRFYIITNSTTGSYTLTVKPSGGTGIAIPQGSTMYLFSNPSTAAMENPVGYLSSLTLASLTTTSLTVNGTAAATTGIALLGAASASAARSTLGLGTAATQNTGTSGANVPLLNGNNTYSGTSAFSGIVTMSAAVNDNKGANIASATTTDIGAATGNYVVVTGTTTITGFGTVQAGTVRIVEFSGAGTLTHNATSLILPGGANITRAAGDVGVFVSEGSGNWRCAAYTKADGTAVAAQTQSFAIFQHQTAYNTGGGTSVSGSWQTRTINTTAYNGITSASLSTNTISLPSGTYVVDWWEHMYGVSHCATKLINTSDSTDYFGESGYAFNINSGNDLGCHTLCGHARFSIASTKSFQIRNYVQNNSVSDGYGTPNNLTAGLTNVFASVRIVKVA